MSFLPSPSPTPLSSTDKMQVIQNCSDESSPPLVELQYPVLSTDSWNRSWPSDRSASEMTPSEGHSDDTGSSLGDSAYEILGDSTILTSDDEDCDDATDSVVSVGEHTPADVTSLADTENSDGASQAELGDASAEVPEGPGEPAEVTRSNLTIKDPATGAHATLEFEEPPSSDGDVAVVHTLRTFDESETLKILKQLGAEESPARLTATIRQSMTGRRLDIEEPFRVLYVGDTSEKEAIIAKLASALAVPVLASSSQPAVQHHSSRFNVVPVSFDDSGSPEVELIDSLGLELVVNECTAALSQKVDNEPDIIGLFLNRSVWYLSRWTSKGFVREGCLSWKLPHLAVIFCSAEDAGSARETRLIAQSFMARHDVATLMISHSSLSEMPTENFSLNPHSLHFCLESRDLKWPNNRVIKRLPIDLSSFLAINARQLNRNLAYLTGQHGEKGSGGVERPMRNSRTRCIMATPEDVEKFSQRTSETASGAHLFRPREGQEWRALILLGVLMLCVLAGTSSTLLYHKFGGVTRSAQRGNDQHGVGWTTASSTAAPVAGASPTPPPRALSALIPGANVGTSLSTDRPDSKSLALLSSQEDLIKMLRTPSLSALNQSDEFKIQIVGDCHIILRPPQKLVLLRKSPSLLVKVVRHGQAVNVELSKLFEGVYALQFQREDAWGVMNVTVSTKSKPFLEQTFQADFGTPWLKLNEWRKAAYNFSMQLQNGLRQAHTEVEESLARMGMEVQTAFRQVIRSGRNKGQNAGSLQGSSLGKAARKAKQLSDEVEMRRIALLKELDNYGTGVFEALARRVAELTSSNAELLRVRDKMHELGVRASKTLTVQRAQQQARRLWSTVLSKREQRWKTKARSPRRKERTHRRRFYEGWRR